MLPCKLWESVAIACKDQVDGAESADAMARSSLALGPHRAARCQGSSAVGRRNCARLCQGRALSRAKQRNAAAYAWPLLMAVVREVLPRDYSAEHVMLKLAFDAHNLSNPLAKVMAPVFK